MTGNIIQKLPLISSCVDHLLGMANYKLWLILSNGIPIQDSLLVRDKRTCPYYPFLWWDSDLNLWRSYSCLSEVICVSPSMSRSQCFFGVIHSHCLLWISVSSFFMIPRVLRDGFNEGIIFTSECFRDTYFPHIAQIWLSVLVSISHKKKFLWGGLLEKFIIFIAEYQ